MVDETTQSHTFLEALIKSLRDAGTYNRNDMSAPAAVLWPDEDRQWEPLLPILRRYLPILTLGEYDPKIQRGPAVYIRCMISRALSEDRIPDEATPIIYLPGIGKGKIRAVEDCPQDIRPLVDLQYRGTMWVQANGKDWSVLAFLKSSYGGLGIDTAEDNDTKNALLRCLLKLAGETVDSLKENVPLRAPFFNNLLTPDESRSLLLWMNDPEAFQLQLKDEEWDAFCQICESKYGFHPEIDGVITAAVRMAGGKGNWPMVWSRFKEAPQSYPGIPNLMRRASPSQLQLTPSEFWPQDNESEEENVQQQLVNLLNLSAHEARKILRSLEDQHRDRRDWVWAKLGQSPLAEALYFLARLAEFTDSTLTGDSVQVIAEAYSGSEWHSDYYAIEAQKHVSKQEDVDAVTSVIRLIYQPWLESSIDAFQRAVKQHYPHKPMARPANGTCIVFSDALRMDVAQILANQMEASGYDCNVGYQLAALPTITATAKPAILDVGDKITGKGSSTPLAPSERGKNSPLSAVGFRRILEGEGYQILKGSDLGDPSGVAWTEIGDIDTYGHNHGAKLIKHIDGEISLIKNRIQVLLDYGWKKISVVTDHGWLLMPGGLPKAHIPEHLTEVRKGRCAVLKDTSDVDFDIIRWFWDDDVSIVVAHGIHCFEAGKEYEHGGISPQECITPVVNVVKTTSGKPDVSFENIKWLGLRCVGSLSGDLHGCLIDIRGKAGDSSSSFVGGPQKLETDGGISLLVENEDLFGSAAFIVVLDPSGSILAQTLVTIGG